MKSKNEDSNESLQGPSWMEPHREAYLKKLADSGYSDGQRRKHEGTVHRFCEALGKCEPDDSVTIDACCKVAIGNGTAGSRFNGAKYQMKCFMDYLTDGGVISLPVPPAKPKTELDCLREEFCSYLRLMRGLSEATIRSSVDFFDQFMRFRFPDGLGNLESITPEDIHVFFSELKAKNYRGKTASPHLRNFFRFLFWSGKTTLNLANMIPKRSQPGTGNLPRYLPSEEVQQLIDGAYSNSAIGRRDYAILLLMARLGLRATEVVAIQLEDLDWRAGEILVRGKGKLHDRMPLPDEVGAAIVDYIQNGRKGSSRSLFVSVMGPHQAFKDAQNINCILAKALKRSGLKQPQKNIGSHLLRHSLATTLVARGASLEEIARVMRHRSRATTMIYAKCDLDGLRSIAQPWPEEGGAS